MGRPHRLAGPHAKRPVRALGSIPPGGSYYPFTPVSCSSMAWLARRRRVPPRPPWRSNRGQSRDFASPLSSRAAALQRREEGRNPRCPSHQPHWGFLSPFLCLRCERRRMGRKRGGEGFDLEARFAFAEAPRWRGQEPELREPIAGAGTPRCARGSAEPHARAGVGTSLPSRTAVSVRPTTTPLPTQSEETASALHFSPP
jgi:hypothetical protein